MSKYIFMLRNNWKKTTFGCVALSYATQFARNKYNDTKLMEEYCREALEIGKQPLPVGKKPRSITVILNPAANKNKAKKHYEQYAAPLLHLAGISVDLVQTQRERHATQYVEELENNSQALIVAGGDGTLSETVTGLLRRSDADILHEQKFPIGVIPLGKLNLFAEKLFNGLFNKNKVEFIANATMAIIKNEIKTCDVIKIKMIENSNINNTNESNVKNNTETKESSNNENEEENAEPKQVLKHIYCLTGLEWGVFRDANTRADKYWYWGSLNRHVSYIFTGLKSLPDICWNCIADIRYTLPCSGCSKCYETIISLPKNQTQYKSWFPFFSKQNDKSDIDKIKSIQNKECGMYLNKKISTSNLSVKVSNKEEESFIELDIAQDRIGYFDYISEGWKRLKDEPNIIDSIKAQKIELYPVDYQLKDENATIWISIDNEAFELKPLELVCLPKRLHVFRK